MEIGAISEKRISQICNQILSADNSIYYLTVVDYLGQVIYESTNRKVPETVSRLEPSDQVKSNSGPQIAIISGIFQLAEPLLGISKYTFGAYKNSNVLIIPLRRKKLSVVALISPNADERKTFRTIKRFIDQLV